jgi:hypothetical protein
VCSAGVFPTGTFASTRFSFATGLAVVVECRSRTAGRSAADSRRRRRVRCRETSSSPGGASRG